QISDLHAGSTIRLPYIRKITEMVKRIECDAIVMTGDIADGRVSTLQKDVAPLGELSAPHGMFFVTGNHEYYSGVEEWTVEMKRLGFEVLLNENRIFERNGQRIIMAGVTDYEGGRFSDSHVSDPEKSVEAAMHDDFKILLAHQPLSIFKAEQAGFDFMISGHTHGGQYIPWNFFIRIQQPYTSGLHTHGKTQLYINRGTGYWGPPLRGGIPSEISVITLKKS
ncbi:metallophosphoesterase, partial [Candidatus Latescibacterota bacterium]